MAIGDSRNKFEEQYDALVKSTKDLNAANTKAEREKQNAEIAAAKAAQAEKKEAAAEVPRAKRRAKSDEASKALWDEQKSMSTSIRAYDTLANALVDVSSLARKMSDAIKAEVWSLLAGPILDGMYEGGVYLAKLPLTLSSHAVMWATNELSEYCKEHSITPEFLAVSPLDMVSVNDNGDLVFKHFKEDPDLKKEYPEELLQKADSANQTMMTYLVKKAGYEYNNGCYEKDGEKLDQTAFKDIVQEYNMEDLMNDTKNSEPEPEPEQSASPSRGMGHS